MDAELAGAAKDAPEPQPIKNRVSRQKLIPDSPRGRAVAVVKAKCLECCNFDRSEIRDCTVLACPLWAYRPFQVQV